MTILKNKDNSKSCMSVNKSIGVCFEEQPTFLLLLISLPKMLLRKEKKSQM